MSTHIIRLLGVPADRAKLTRLAKLLSGFDIRCELDLRGPRSSRPLKLDAPDRDGGAVTAYALCWTAASIGKEGSRIQQCAIELKARNAYIGLLLDDVLPPEEVRSADDLNLVARTESGEDAAAAAAAESLKARMEARGTADGRLSVLLRLLTGTLKGLGVRVRTIGIVTAVGAAVGVFGFYANWVGSRDELCKEGWIQGFCRSVGAGRLPTPQEESEWKAIVRGSSCEAFERHLARYGWDGAFAGEANQRLALAEPLTTPMPFDFGLSIPSAETSAPNKAEAKAKTLRRASGEAADACRGYAQAYEGETQPGRFVATEGPFCEGDRAPYLCRARGRAECVFLVPDKFRTCPATSR